MKQEKIRIVVIEKRAGLLGLVGLSRKRVVSEYGSVNEMPTEERSVMEKYRKFMKQGKRDEAYSTINKYLVGRPEFQQKGVRDIHMEFSPQVIINSDVSTN